MSLGVPGTSLTPAEVTAELLRRIKSLDSGATVAEDADDVMRLVFAVTAGVYVNDAQRERAVRIVLDGIHVTTAHRRGQR